MMKYLRLVRWMNLLIVAGTLYIMRLFILRPLLEYAGFQLLFDEWHFLLLVISAICYTAAGYVINDYFDTQTDIMNRPDRVIVGRKISRRLAITIHFVLNAIAAIIGVYISFYIRISALAAICLIIPGILWFYSTSYKRQLIIGNIIVALLTALVPLAVFLSEMPLQARVHGQTLLGNHAFISMVFYWIGGFSFFAFLLTLIREIVKDVEDYEGDAAFGRNSLPVALGIAYTKLILYLLIALTVVSIILVYIRFLTDTVTLLYFLVLLIIPLIIIAYLVYKASGRKDYSRISFMLKLIMLAGLSYAVVADLIMRYSIV